MNELVKQLRTTLIALLDDDEGVNEAGYVQLQNLANQVSEGSATDIFNAVEGAEGRRYLPEDHGLTA